MDNLFCTSIDKVMNGIPEAIKEIKGKAFGIYSKELQGLNEEQRKTILKVVDYMEKQCIAHPVNITRKVVFLNIYKS
jgi:hypothetical protein